MVLFSWKVTSNYCFFKYENIYSLYFFYSPNSAKITELVILRKMQYFRHEILAFFAILPILSYLHFWEIFWIRYFRPRKKCVNSLSSSKNTRKMTVIKTLMARLAYTRSCKTAVLVALNFVNLPFFPQQTFKMYSRVPYWSH